MIRRTILAVAAALALCTVGLAATDDKKPMDVTGTVSAVSQDSMTISTDDNKSLTFKLTDETMRLPGVAVGDRVNVNYRDTWGTDTALNVSRAGSTYPMPGSTGSDLTAENRRAAADDLNANRNDSDYRSNLSSVEGRVVSISSTNIVIDTESGERRTFMLNSNLDRTNLTSGNRVRIDYDGTGSPMMARSVTPVTNGTGEGTGTTDVAGNMGNYRARRDIPNTASLRPLLILLGTLSVVAGSTLWFGRREF